MSIEEFSFNEHRMIVAAEGRYGDFFRTSRDVTLPLWNIMTWPMKDCDIFIRFLSQMKKSHRLCQVDGCGLPV
ncbi:hypothetical protein [Paraburkholderia sediminicola]|uniref:hypothetical protein n=1 Tax=Paraburkholderia sediminicola TaxID=458836 RepID=UPI000EAF21D5